MIQRASLLKRSFTLAALLLGVIPSLVYAANYYVDGNNGSNIVGTGAYENPWETINYAISQSTGTDTVYVKYATYNESVSFAPIPKRSISLIGIAEGDAKPIIHSPNADTIKLVNYTGTIQGLEITGDGNTIGINCIARGGTNTAKIVDCSVHENSVGVHVTTVRDTDNSCPRIYKNSICSNRMRGIGNMKYSSATIEANYIYENGNGSVDHNGIGNRDNSAATIINNIIYDNNNSGISIRDSAKPVIANNIISNHDDNNNGIALKVMQNEGIFSLVIINNIITHNSYGLVNQYGQTCSGNDYNDVWNNSLKNYVGFSEGLHDISGDPFLVDPYNGDYHLAQGSPCIDAGDPVEILTEDYNAGAVDIQVDSVTAISIGDIVWITDGLMTESGLVEGTSSSTITIESGLAHSYLVADGAYVYTISSDFSVEPQPNGGRINIGAYRGTCIADFNGNDAVDRSDSAIFAADFGRTDYDQGEPCQDGFYDDGDVTDRKSLFRAIHQMRPSVAPLDKKDDLHRPQLSRGVKKR